MSQTTIQTIGLTDSLVTSIKIATGAVETIKIADDAVTIAKINFENALVPIGGIIMWSGTIANIPTGWALCNGANATPDLRDKFVVGAGSGYAVAAIGGTADAVVPEHNHSATFTGSNSISSLNAFSLYGSGSGTAVATGNDAAVTGSVDVANAGESGTNKNLPPYYALAFIMRTS